MKKTSKENNVFDKFVKRDGSVVPFRVEKIKDAIFAAAKVVASKEGREAEDKTADKLAAKVVSTLNNPESCYYVRENDEGDRIPEIEDVQDVVEIVLAEEGHTKTLAEYKRYRKLRQLARERIEVRKKQKKDNLSVTDQSLLLVEPITDNVTKPWDRSKITGQLVTEVGMLVEEANSIAKAVENRVIDGDYETISSALIREMVNDELRARGYKRQLKDLSIYVTPKDYIEGLMYDSMNENSNLASNNPEAVNLGIAELILKQWGMDNIFSPEVKRAHNTGMMHLHDLGYPHRVYCSSHSLEYIKKYGLVGLENLNTDSSPAKSAEVLTGHLNTFLASMQAYYAGALGIAYINILYAPYLEDTSYDEMYQIAQELIFNASQNAFSRGAQTLFLDFNIHTGVPSYLKNVPAIGPGGNYMLMRKDGTKVPVQSRTVGTVEETGNPLMELYIVEDDGERVLLREEDNGKGHIYYNHKIEDALKERGEKVVTYGDYSETARNFTKALLNVWKDGDKNGRVFEFPKCDFHVNVDTFNDPEQYKIFEEACKLASHNASTYFVFDRDEVTLSACCRLRTTIQDNYMLLHPESMRFCGFQNVTINIPQAAYRAAANGNKTLAGLKDEIHRAMDLAMKAHLQKKESIAKMMEKPGRPLWQIGKKAHDGRPYVELDKATYIMGLIGLNDALNFIFGKELDEDEAMIDKGLEVVGSMYKWTKEYSEKHGLRVALEESPAESAARKLAKSDLTYYNEEASDIVKGSIEDDSAYYTNSVHLKAASDASFVKRIREQGKFHLMIESGAITHAFVGEEKPSHESVANLVKNAFFRTQTAQLVISPEFTYCNACQYNDRGLQETCRKCGSEDVTGMTRVVGYFSKVDNWNDSKRFGELKDRQKGNYSIETGVQ